MAKINYNKVEEELKLALDKRKREELLDEASKASEKEEEKKQKEEEEKKKKEEKKEDTEEKKSGFKEDTVFKVISTMKKDLVKLNKKSKHAMFEKLDLDSDEIKKFIKDPSQLNRDDWEKIKKVQGQVSQFTQNEENVDEDFNEEIVKSERLKHINKQFNIKDGWKPI